MKMLLKLLPLMICSLILADVDMAQKQSKPRELKVTRISFPMYPTKAVALGISGDVKIKLTIDAEGEVIRTEALVGNGLLVQAVRNSLVDIQFEADSTEREVILTFIFSIIPNGVDPKVKTKIRYEPPDRILVFENQIVVSDGIPMEPNKPEQ